MADRFDLINFSKSVTTTLGGTTANVNIDANTLFLDGVNNRVGIGTATPAVSLAVGATDAVLVPVGNSAQRPAGATGYVRYNTTSGSYEGHNGVSWGVLNAVEWISGNVIGSVANVDIPIPTGDEFELHLNAIVPATNDAFLLARVSTDGGVNYQTTNYRTAAIRYVFNSTGAEGRTDGWGITASVATAGVSSTASNGGVSAQIRFWPSGSAAVKNFFSTATYYTGSTQYRVDYSGQWSGGNAAINSIRLLFSTGNIASGRWDLYRVNRGI